MYRGSDKEDKAVIHRQMTTDKEWERRIWYISAILIFIIFMLSAKIFILNKQKSIIIQDYENQLDSFECPHIPDPEHEGCLYIYHMCLDDCLLDDMDFPGCMAMKGGTG